MYGWQFLDNEGTFRLENPQNTSYLYFPLVNEAGLMSVVTPTLHGDIKTGQHSFLTPPVSVEDLHNTRSARNFWVTVEGRETWSATGCSAAQIVSNDDKVTLEAGFLWHRVIRENPRLKLRAEVTNLVPPTMDTVELMKITITNLADKPVNLTPTAAIPIFGRSADNVRDHRHVTSLLHRIRCTTRGVMVKPTLSFDERGHHQNAVIYAVFGVEGDGSDPTGFFPVVEDFIGEGGTLDWPRAVTQSIRESTPAGTWIDGYEAIGGLRFADRTLASGESQDYILILVIIGPSSTGDEAGIGEDWEAPSLNNYASASAFDEILRANQNYWRHKLSTLAFGTADPQLDGWLKWVSLQPTLRRLFGNSFLPYHDYGRGGRGWRDLWQDIQALLLMEPGAVDGFLFSNFAGVRMDGSNATIIGSQPGEFKADRNNIPRVWMDHGAWPWLTTQLYLDQTGDMAFLLREQVYFKDSHISRCRAHDLNWEASQGTVQRTIIGDLYSGTVLEHLLVQHLTAFFNVGEHNNLKLEGADWNDGMDMAPERGESVAFTALYASNLRQLSQVICDLQAVGVSSFELAVELLPLLDTIHGDLRVADGFDASMDVTGKGTVDYASPSAKQARLAEYFAGVSHFVSGEKMQIAAQDLAADLRAKADSMFIHLRQNEWIRNAEGFGWFNGYYDNDGNRLEGDHPLGVRMTLTGQVFSLMGGSATGEQSQAILRAVDRYLFDPAIGGHRLNTDFKEVLPKMGRCFGFAFGHKENGAMFSHMAVMYAYALYERGFAREGFHVLETIYRHCVDFPTSRMYPGIPEYMSSRGRGMYPYLTGSASWYLLTLVTRAYGVRGMKGDLCLAPKLVREEFGSSGKTSVTTLFAGKILRVVYDNSDKLDVGQYQVDEVILDGRKIDFQRKPDGVIIPRTMIIALEPDATHILTVTLKKCHGEFSPRPAGVMG